MPSEITKIGQQSLNKLVSKCVSPGVAGQLLLISPTLATLSCTIDVGLNQLVTAVPHGIVTGTPVKVTTGQLAGNRAYEAVEIDSVTFRLRNAISLAALTLPNEGTMGIQELDLTPNTPLAALVNREIYRTTISASSGDLKLTGFFVANQTNAPLQFKNVVFLSGQNTLGSAKSVTNATGAYVVVNANPTTINPDESLFIRPKIEIHLVAI